MSQHNTIRRRTVKNIASAKGKTPLVCLTAYDARMAQLLDPHCDVLLVGDSLGMVVHGLPSTVGVTLEMMILHAKAVMRGAQRAMVVVDMPFGSFERAPQQAFENAARILGETGAQAVKLETGAHMADTVSFLVERGVPVMGHVGLRPQAVNVLGGYGAQGKDAAGAAQILADAKAIDAAGAFSMVIEGVAEDVARDVTQAVRCPTIGIGASATCDGQILVTEDMLGMFDRVAKFVKTRADLAGVISQAAAHYAEEVKERSFPGAAHVYAGKAVTLSE